MEIMGALGIGLAVVFTGGPAVVWAMCRGWDRDDAAQEVRNKARDLAWQREAERMAATR